MVLLQLVCLAIVALYVITRVVRAEGAAARSSFLVRFAALAVAAAIGEDSVIRAYGTYAYAPSWSCFLDRVPLVVVLVWPVVIDSAATLARRALGVQAGAWRIAGLTSAIVLADASLIEPIAVGAGLWAWTSPGLFDVPFIGVAGWAMFAGAASFVFARLDARSASAARGAPGVRARAAWIVVPIAPAATHVLLLVSWWCLFRWIDVVVPPQAAIVASWILVVPLTLLAWRVGRAIPMEDVLLRAPGALFFFALLVGAPVVSGRPALVAYALGFAPPYLIAMVSRARASAMQRRAA